MASGLGAHGKAWTHGSGGVEGVKKRGKGHEKKVVVGKRKRRRIGKGRSLEYVENQW